MSPRPRTLRIAAAAVLVIGVLAVVLRWASSSGSSANELFGAADILPASVVERGLFATTEDGIFDSGYGVAPGRVDPELASAYGITGEQIRAVVESGGPPVTVLLGGFDAELVAARFTDLGYAVAVENGWSVVRGGAGASGPLAAGVPAAAVRKDVIVLGGEADVDAAVNGPSARSVSWMSRVLGSVEPGWAAVAVAPGPAGGDLEGWALALGAADGENREGQFAATYASGGGGPAAAGTLASAIGATAGLGTGDEAVLLEPSTPTWDAGAAVAGVRLAARGSASGWAQLRESLASEGLPFLP